MIEQLEQIVKSGKTSPEEKETAVLEICKGYAASNDFKSLLTFISNLKDLWTNLTVARTTKIIGILFDVLPCTEDNLNEVLALLDGLIAWSENKKMLKLDLQCKRIHALLKIGMYHECLKTITLVIKELKKYDDKANLINLYVYESKAFYELKNIPRSKSSLTSARALAVSTYTSSKLQASIDLLNGMYISDERNYSTAFSYFVEALEGFSLDKQWADACIALRYLILSQIIAKNNCDINAIMKNKHTLRYLDDECVLLLLKIAEVCKNRDLCGYNNLITSNASILQNDTFICSHLGYLYDMLLDKNILKIIEPYSNISISTISEALGFDLGLVETKLRKMILDKTIKGILDHVNQSLILYGSKESYNYEIVYMQQIEKLQEFVSQLN